MLRLLRSTCFLQLFCDVKRSTQYLMDYQHEFMFHEINPADVGLDGMRN